MRSRHVLLLLKGTMSLAGLLYGAMSIMYQYWAGVESALGFASDFPTPNFDDGLMKTTSVDADLAKDKERPTATTIKSPSVLSSSPLLEGEFNHHDGVAIVTKIHGPHQWGLLSQSLCLLHFAYNKRVHYDVVVFTAELIPQEKIEDLEKLLAPVSITVALDNNGLKEEISALSPSRRRYFLDRCRHHIQNTTMQRILTDESLIENLNWFSDCGDGRLAYNWQAEFRSWHIWHHPALAKFKWMMWMDSDAFCTKQWERDPVAIAIHEDLTIFFDNYHGGGSRKLSRAIAKAFNVSLCNSRMNAVGELESKIGEVKDAEDNEFCNNSRIESIHGFFHVTNLDFYRRQAVMEGIMALFGNCFLCRFPDDQFSITIPAAIFAPSQSWDMRRKGVKLDVFHNLRIDGRDEEKTMGFKQLWKLKRLRQSMKEARGICPVTERA